MSAREGSLEAPTRHPLDWKSADFYDDAKLDGELERVFEICHGCRRCVNLCTAFPTLFDLVDGSPTLEVDGVAKQDYAKVDTYMRDTVAGRLGLPVQQEVRYVSSDKLPLLPASGAGSPLLYISMAFFTDMESHIELADGRLVEHGGFGELERSGSLFAELIAAA